MAARAEARSDATTRLLAETLDRATALADSILDTLRPVPLMRPADEERLRRQTNAVHVARARALGVRPATDAALEAMLRDGRLVVLDDSTEHWIVREMRLSSPYVTPDVPPLLREIARRFHARLDAMGLPPYRLEITSVMRTAADQAALRRINPNAARGTSSHEFGTALDIAYEAFAPPLELPAGLVPDAPAGVRPYLEQVASLALETASAKKSRELTAILGQVMAELQAEGAVLVIMERLQPVYHITVARRAT